jgi:magnesium transporter
MKAEAETVTRTPLRETICTGIPLNLSMVMIDESEATKRPAAWASIIAASTALGGVPELRWAWSCAAALGVTLTVCGLLYWRLKRVIVL